MSAERPNIILIMTDQQRYDSIAALGFPYVETPNLDRLVKEGTTFTNCHITAASCVPCRASLFNGYYPHTTGVLANGQAWQRTWVEKLAASGYRCVNMGKMHTIPYNAPAGFHERYVVENKDRYMEGRWYFDEWDKALAAHGLVKQQRERYRKLLVQTVLRDGVKVIVADKECAITAGRRDRRDRRDRDRLLPSG